MSAVPRNLFGEAADPPRSAARGWAALPVVRREIRGAARNATGRRTLIFCYRRQRAWTDPEVQRAEALIEYYWRKIGGFRKADQAVISAWIDALRDYADADIRRAIDFKTESLAADNELEARYKRLRYTPAPENFPRTIDRWLARADAWEQRCADQVVMRACTPAPPAPPDLRDALGSAVQDLPIHDPAATPPLPLPLLRAALEQIGACRASLRAAGVPLDVGPRLSLRELADQVARLLRVAWQHLTPEQRDQALAAVRSDFERGCVAAGRDPTAAESADVLIWAALAWAQQRWPRPFAARIETLAQLPPPGARSSDPPWARQLALHGGRA